MLDRENGWPDEAWSPRGAGARRRLPIAMHVGRGLADMRAQTEEAHFQSGLVPRAGLEPTTNCLEGNCSIL